MRIFKSPFLAIILTSVWCSVLTGQSYVVHKSHTGFDQLLYKQILIDKATEVQDSLQSYGVNDFTIVGDDYYHLYNFIGEGSTFETYHGFSLNDIESHYPNGFLFIAKEHSEEGKLRYRVELKTPSDGLFSELDPFEAGAVASNILAEINRVAALNNFSKGGNAGAEAAGLALFLNYLRALDSGDFSLQTPLHAAGFEGTAVINEDVVTVDAGEVAVGGEQYGYGYVAYDYAGVKVSNNGGTPTLLRDLLTNDAAQDIASIEFGLSNALIITGAGNSEDDIRSAEDKFENTNESFVLWVHYQSYANSTDSLHIKTKSNLSLAQEEAVVDWYFYQIMSIYRPDLYPPVIVAAKEEDQQESLDKTANSCTEFSFEYGKNCILPIVEDWESDPSLAQGYLQFHGGMGVGLLDGLFGTLKFLWETGVKWHQRVSGTITSIFSYGVGLWNHYRQKGTFISVLKKVRDDATNLIENEWKDIVSVYETMKDIVYLATQTNWSPILADVYEGIKMWLVTTLSDAALSGYYVGLVAFEVMILAFTRGKSASASFLPRVMTWVGKLGKGGQVAAKGIRGMLVKAQNVAEEGSDLAKKIIKCKILGRGCFVRNTPVLMASSSNQYSLKNVGKAMVVAAILPIVGVPIQEVQLLDYAVAHETINSTYETTASVDDDIYLGLTGKDPYTSDQQRERDRYEINDIDWHEVVFEEVYGSSAAKFALHIDWIKQKSYQVDAVVNLNLPEQGISGPFRITSIEHILPQNKPTDDDKSDDYDYRPVTALFTHVSDQVYNISFENGEELGVTYQHPIYSVTAGDWKLAGELVIGEKVLTKSGETTVTRLFKKEGKEAVYNLEIKDFHNFLVGESGIVVHNACFLSNKNNLPTLNVLPEWLGIVQKEPTHFANHVEIIKDALGRKLLKIAPGNVKDFQWNSRGFDFIITKDGQLKIGNGHGFLAGHKHNANPDILGAGVLKINRNTGRIESVTGHSGHYKPDLPARNKIIQKFIDEGLYYE
jgi:hypothetical protein